MAREYGGLLGRDVNLRRGKGCVEGVVWNNRERAELAFKIPATSVCGVGNRVNQARRLPSQGSNRFYLERKPDVEDFKADSMGEELNVLSDPE
jgi:hypothetical protein